MDLFDIAIARKLAGGGGGGGGSSDFSTCTLTVVNDEGMTLQIPTIIVNAEYGMEGSIGETIISDSSYTVILYKGKAYVSLNDVESTSGDIEYVYDLDMYVITGDCTVVFEALSF